MTRGKRRYLLALVENADACEECLRLMSRAPYFDAFCGAACWTQNMLRRHQERP